MKKFSLLALLVISNSLLPFYQNLWEQVRDQVSQSKLIIGCGALFGGFFWYNHRLHKAKDARMQQLSDAQLKMQNEKVAKKLTKHAQKEAESLVTRVELFKKWQTEEALQSQVNNLKSVVQKLQENQINGPKLIETLSEIENNQNNLSAEITTIQESIDIPSLFDALSEKFANYNQQLEKHTTTINLLNKTTVALADKVANLSKNVDKNDVNHAQLTKEIQYLKEVTKEIEDSANVALQVSDVMREAYKKQKQRVETLEEKQADLVEQINPLLSLYEKFRTRRISQKSWSPGAGANPTYRKSVKAIEWKTYTEE